MSEKSKQLDQHFRFGENWRSFLGIVTDDVVEEAEKGLLRLFPDGVLKGASFLDIGCGSGLHLLAAIRLGVAQAHGVDLDPLSVETARALIAERAPGAKADLAERSIFTLDPDEDGRHAIVYSWGVLHHTGAMWEAVDKASKLVAELFHTRS